jgi:cytochrome c553
MNVSTIGRLLVVWLAIAPAALRAQPDALSASVLAANCTGCHGPNGKSRGAIPSIAGLDKTYFIEAMQAFRAGQRQPTVMHQHAKGYTDTEIETLAQHFASQPRR